MNDLLVAYTAGLLDGEGSIQINATRTSGKNKYWGLTVQISSSCLRVLTELQQSWGLGRVTSWQPRGKEKYRISGNWRIYSQEAEKFLTAVLPHLKIKQENAVLALEFRKYCGFKRGQLTEEVARVRTDYAVKMRELNKRYGKGKCNLVTDGVR